MFSRVVDDINQGSETPENKNRKLKEVGSSCDFCLHMGKRNPF